jgi:hypothetical protein
MRAAGEHQPFAALAAGRFEHLVGPHDVGFEDVIEGVLVRDAGKVNDGIDTRHRLRSGPLNASR